MGMIRRDEKEEMLRLVRSASLQKDMGHVSAIRHNPLVVDGNVSMDRWIEFLTGFNEFINHARKPFSRIIDRDMRL